VSRTDLESLSMEDLIIHAREHPEEREALAEELTRRASANAERTAEAFERIHSDRWEERFLDQVADEWIDALEEFRASLTPEFRENSRALPMIEEMIRGVAPDTRERIGRRRSERGLPPMIWE
jgi:hypothetical protein